MPTCEGCSKKLDYDEPYHAGHDGVDLCPSCAPTYGEIQKNPDTLVHLDSGEPLDQSEALEIVANHLAKGGQITDPYLST